LTIYSNTEAIEDVKALIDQNIEIGEDGAEPPLIHDIITE
jgi:pyrimidine-nucleoside phosphorylase